MVNGWERVDYIKPASDLAETHGFRFTEVHDLVAAEVAAVHTGVGLTEVNGFNRIEITGPDRHAFLDRMVCGRLPRRPGRVGLTYLLNGHGMLKSEATIANLSDGPPGTGAHLVRIRCRVGVSRHGLAEAPPARR